MNQTRRSSGTVSNSRFFLLKCNCRSDFGLSSALLRLQICVFLGKIEESEQENQQTLPTNLKLTFPRNTFSQLLDEAVYVFVPILTLIILVLQTHLHLRVSGLALSICLRSPKCHWSHLVEQRSSITQKVALSEARRCRPPRFHRLIPSLTLPALT